MVNKSTVDLLTSPNVEGLKLKAYQCTAGVWTIGVGHTSDDYFAVKKGDTITKEKAIELLYHDLEEAEDTIKRQFPDWELLSENQYGAIVSFVFNTGSLKYYDKKKKMFMDRTILIKLKKHDWQGVGESFLIYTKDRKGNKLKGLENRRKLEKALWEKIG